MESTTKRRIAIGCAVAFVLLAIPYLCAGVVNVLVNELTLTHGLKKELGELSHVRNEFDRKNDRTGLVAGRVVGTRHLQFENVLEGPGRILDVKLCKERFGPTTLSEARTALPARHKAYMWVQLTCCMVQEDWMELFQIEEGDEKDVPEMTERIFDTRLPPEETEFRLVYLNMANVFEFSTAWYTFEKREDGVWEVTNLGDSIQQEYDLDVRWVKRDRGEMRRRKLGYGLTVPADVIGWPVHVLMLFALAGSVV